MFGKVLIANRGAIACRIIRTLRKMGVGSVAVYSQADRHSLHVRQADEAVAIPGYLDIAALLDAAAKTGAEAIHPGYGFLSENAAFAEACGAAGIVFLGPTPAQMRDFGLKHTARRIAAENQTPLLPGTELLASLEEAVTAAQAIGYPLMLKSTAGGGGIGMRLCASETELVESYAAVQHLSQTSFGTAGLYLEKFVSNARHIEVQIFGDGKGGVVALGERDCSAQRRNQKVIEETPAPGVGAEARANLLAAAIRLGEAVNYQSAGTVEFIYDNDTGRFYFLEVNTRLQVEHGVTEEVTGIDLVECMVRREMPRAVAACGHSIQVRLYAEDPAHNFQPSAGKLSHVVWPSDARVETWVESGTEVTPYYDPMLAKIIVRGETRHDALAKMREALAATQVYGVESNLEYLRQVCAHPAFEAGGISTGFLRDFPYSRNAIEILDPGTQTTVQDYPGRLGYWHVGVPPSGPMDALSFRLANRLVGNPESAAALEITFSGPILRFTSDAVIALTGAKLALPSCQAIPVKAGTTLELGSIQGAGVRAYLAVAGGIDVPEYLGSRSAFILGKFGGHAGRTLPVGAAFSPAHTHPVPSPALSNSWNIAVLYGPHGAPDFFTPEDIEMFFSTAWKVHHNSDRTGVRLIGPKPAWARRDGGEAGLHPSNIHDNAYAIGTIDFTGDMPVILGPDGPSLGGFVCPATIVQADLWKIGQLKPGDLVRFTAVSLAQANAMEAQLDAALAALDGNWPSVPVDAVRESPVLCQRTSAAGCQAGPSTPMLCRADGDRYLLIEYGPNVLDLNLRFRVHALESNLKAAGLRGIIDITPGVRSLHVHYDSRLLSRQALLDAIDSCDRSIPDLDDITVPSRIVHLPLSWDDPQTQLAIRKYTQSVRPDAPWAPSNIEFIRRINGLESLAEVHRIVYSANYLVLGLGDVYLGAPVATPTDPRHRLVTTKYNPARTWTPENAVGIGGAYLCVYGMEGPGGYQFVGRTLQMWNTYRAEPPWLLRFFDQIRFYPVSAEELLEIRDAFPHGGYPLRTESQDFRLFDYHAFLRSIEGESAAFKRTQQEAFLAERQRWAESGLDTYREPPDVAAPEGAEDRVPEGCRAVASPVTASVWNIAVQAGQRVEAGDRLLVLEAMKMEIAVAAPFAGIVERLNCSPGALVSAGQNLITVRQEVAV
ncbi:MAG TPA: urea carboxylase [Candidatus Sulfopaludibacter sp.]|jgi:urea carboxylase|nr:urea carboxylase [Candidatus Sulfopaludibacter sp.]